jgi:hypothetical protein
MPSSVRTIFRILFCTLLLAVFWLALMPAPNIAKLVSWQDKIEHALAFATLALLAYAGWPRHPLRIAAGLLRHTLELLAPAKTADFGIEAINHGADAVYIGGPAFGARSSADNSVEDIARLVQHAHRYHAQSSSPPTPSCSTRARAGAQADLAALTTPASTP